MIKSVPKHRVLRSKMFKCSKLVENWFEYIDVQRKFLRTTFGEVLSNLSFYEEKYGNKLFLKTVKNNFQISVTLFKQMILKNYIPL